MRDSTDKSLNSKIEMKRKSRLPRQKTVNNCKSSSSELTTKKNEKTFKLYMGFKVVKSKQLRELPLLEVKVELHP